MDNNLELGIKASEMALAMAGAEDAIIIVTDGVEANGSVPKDAFITAALIVAALDEAPKGTKEAVKKYLNEGGNLS